MTDSGYLHPLYAQSLSEFGEPLQFQHSGGWILRRPIHETSYFDGMGCYPIFVCQDWSKLGNDMEQVSNQLVALSLVTDPFGNYTREELSLHFKDIVLPYKEHFVIDLRRRPVEFVAKHHQRNALKALKTVKVEISTEPLVFLEEWVALYTNLIQRHNIQGMTRFSRAAFAIQLSIPGVVAFRAIDEDKTIGMLLWYKQGDIGYYHLGAYSELGYERKASFALFWTLMEYFADTGLQWLSLGAGAGSQNAGQDGLTRFKRGWSTETRQVYFCGHIFDNQKYLAILEKKGVPTANFFPAYRYNDF